MKVMSPVLAHCMLDVGQGDKLELGFVDDDAVGPLAPHFGLKDLDIDPDLLLKVELESQDCDKEFKNIGNAGLICPLDACIQQVFDL